MSLRDLARADLRAISNNTASDGWAIDTTLTSPADVATAVKGISNDIGALIDPDTGTAVMGRTITLVVHIDDLPAGARPRHIMDGTGKPWRVSFVTTTGGPVVEYKVNGTDPDEVAGYLTLFLTPYTS